MMRKVILMMIEEGIEIGIGYKWYMRKLKGREIGRWKMMEKSKRGLKVKEVRMEERDEKVSVLIDEKKMKG